MIQPKQEFQKDADRLKAWSNVVDSKLFNDVAAIAFAQMAVSQGNSPDMGTAAAQAFRMEGAKVFLATMMNLADKGEIPKRTPTPNLKQP